MDISDIEQLAGLARVQLTDEEKSRFMKDFEAILGYVKVVNEDSPDVDPYQSIHKNQLNADDNINESGMYSQDILQQAPDIEDSQIKVQRILGNNNE
jgi:aspartyl-tRNA(Asn)/glutamyl-tRNA(Gln) amidotransferase subunit C